MYKDVPFVQNTSDDLHCLQASFMTILKYFRPNMVMDWDEWSVVTGFEEGKGTWPIAGMVWFKEQGFEVKHIELFDFEKFIQDPTGYMKQQYSKEIAKYAIDNTNIPTEKKRAAQLLKHKDVLENRNPTIEDIKKYLDRGFLVSVNINIRVLNNNSGFVGHVVTIFGYDDEHVIMHDPGSPPMPNRLVKIEDLIKAWKDPETDMGEMTAIKYQTIVDHSKITQLI